MKKGSKIIFVTLFFLAISGCSSEEQAQSTPTDVSLELMGILSDYIDYEEAKLEIYDKFVNLYDDEFKGNATEEKLKGLTNVLGSSNTYSTELSVQIYLENGKALKVFFVKDPNEGEYKIFDIQVIPDVDSEKVN